MQYQMMRSFCFIVGSILILTQCRSENSKPQGHARKDNVHGPYTGSLRSASGEIDIEYLIVNGTPILEGDIVLQHSALRAEEPSEAEAGHGVAWTSARWHKGIIPYTIQPGLSNHQEVEEAIAHWEDKTSIRFVERTNERDYVTFRAGELHCWSSVGRVRGQQFITLSPACSTSTIIHEIGHAVGLFHEQGRSDRDAHVTIMWENIDPTYHSAFRKRGSLGVDLGPYDYASIMHYRPSAFSINSEPSIVPKNGASIARSGRLSPGDIAAVAQMYEGIIVEEKNPHLVRLESVLTIAQTRLRGCTLEAIDSRQDQGSVMRSTIAAGDQKAEIALGGEFDDETNAKIILAGIPAYWLSNCEPGDG